MFTLVGFYEAVVGGAGSYINLAGLVDQHVTVSGDKIYVPEFNNIVGAWACVTETAAAPAQGRVRLVSPSLRRFNPYHISPYQIATEPTDPHLFRFHPESPVPLDVTEALEAETDVTDAGAVAKSVLVMLSDGVNVPINGKIYTVNCYANLNGIGVGQWVYKEITFPDDLAVGDYQVVGARAIIADGIAFRFVPIGAAHRPGGIPAQNPVIKDPLLQRFGGFGEWFSFNTNRLPGIEVLCHTDPADTVADIFVDLIRK